MQIMFDMEHFCPYRAEVSYHKVCQIWACERIQNKKSIGNNSTYLAIF